MVRTADDSTTARRTARAGAAPPARGARGEDRVLDRYRLVRRLGAGAFGVVWLAHDERLDRTVAVKRIAMHDDAVGVRAQREARAAARLSHPGIVALYEAGDDAEAVYLVSELVRGRTLGELMREGVLSDRDVLAIGVALCDALAHAHARGVVHRDVKPGNVIVPDQPHEGAGVAKLTDFGVARIAGDDMLTRTGDVVGTLAYMAPEQAEGRPAGAPADLYALALVLFEALAGVNPVRRSGAASTARRVGARLPALGRLRRDLALELCAAIDRAVAAAPEARGTVKELRRALAAALPGADGEPGTIAGSDGLPRENPAPPAADHAPARGLGGAHTLRTRLGAAVGAGGLVAAALGWLDPGVTPLSPLASAAAAALAVLLLPRAGWLATTVALAVWLGGGLGALVLGAALPTALALRRAGTAWSAPAAAPLLGLAGLAGVWPALAGQAARGWHRAALGALGLWWLVLAESLSGERLALGLAPGVAPRPTWEDSAWGAVEHVIAPLATSGVLGLAGVWALGALVLPALVRGRSFAVDLVGATAWAAGLASATRALADTLAWADGPPQMRGLVLAAIAAGLIAVVARASLGEALTRSGS